MSRARIMTIIGGMVFGRVRVDITSCADAPRQQVVWATPSGSFLTALIATVMAVGIFAVGVSDAWAEGISGVRFIDDDTIEVALTGRAVEAASGSGVEAWRVTEADSPDIALQIAQAAPVAGDASRVRLVMVRPLDRSRVYDVVLKSAGYEARAYASTSRWAVFFTILVTAMLINNFVFSRYLGLCIFFGTSQRTDTAIGMGVTFTLVMVCAALMSWALYQLVMRPLGLDFLQIIIFIGVVAIFVQAVDTILRKINPVLFKKLGVYLVLITTNCIILAVPLILADRDYGAVESLMLALGAGLGFALALFLMSGVRERLELAKIPESFRGLPIAFVITGLFALAFMGFSGLTVF